MFYVQLIFKSVMIVVNNLENCQINKRKEKKKIIRLRRAKLCPGDGCNKIVIQCTSILDCTESLLTRIPIGKATVNRVFKDFEGKKKKKP